MTLCTLRSISHSACGRQCPGPAARLAQGRTHYSVAERHPVPLHGRAAGAEPASPNQRTDTVGELPVVGSEDRKSVGSGKSVSVSVDLGGCRIMTKKRYTQSRTTTETKNKDHRIQ